MPDDQSQDQTAEPLCSPNAHDPTKACWSDACWRACQRLQRIIEALQRGE